MSELVLRNRQRVRRVNGTLLRRVVRSLLAELLGVAPWELGVHLVGAAEITRLNEQFLRHAGPTDVITFDYAAGFQPAARQARRAAVLPDRLGAGRALQGEIFICVDEAVRQARRFRTTWQSELVRYVVHGVLHLRGGDDRRAAARRVMKREEDRLLRKLADRVPLAKLAAARAAHRRTPASAGRVRASAGA
jgi:probable rRNA maturation factor